MWISRKKWEGLLMDLDAQRGLAASARIEEARAQANEQAALRERDYFQRLFESERERADRMIDGDLISRGKLAVSEPVRLERQKAREQHRVEMADWKEMFIDEIKEDEFVDAKQELEASRAQASTIDARQE